MQIVKALLLSCVMSTSIVSSKNISDCTALTKLNNKGVEYYNKQEYNKAKDIFLQIIKNPNANYKPFYNLGNIEKIEKNYKQAIFYYNKALSIAPNNSATLSELAKSEFLSKNYKSASTHFRKAFLNSADIDALRHLALTYIYLNQYQKAQNIYEKIIDNYKKENFFDYISIFQLSFLQHNNIKKRYIQEFNSRYKSNKKAQIIAQIYIILSNAQHNIPYTEKLNKLLKNRNIDISWELKQTINTIEKEPNKKIKKELISILESVKEKFKLDVTLKW